MPLVVQIARTPVCGVPKILAHIINHYQPAGWTSRAISLRRKRKRIQFPIDLNWKSAGVRALLKRADVVCVHNNFPHKKWLIRLLAKKPTCFVFHSQPSALPAHIVHAKAAKALIAQYQPLLYPKEGFSLVPNIMPLFEPPYSEDHPLPPAFPFWVGFCPSRKEDPKAQGEMTWSRKGYAAVRRTFKALGPMSNIATSLPKAMNFLDLLQFQLRHHAWVDDIATGSYHRTSLETAALGRLAINNIRGISYDNIGRVTDAPGHPFINCPPHELRATLTTLANTPGRVKELAANARDWMRKYWNPEKQLIRFYLPLFRDARPLKLK